MEQNTTTLSLLNNEENTYVFNEVLKFIFGPKFGTLLYTAENISVDEKSDPLAHYLKIPKDIIHQLRSEPNERFVISALLEEKLVAQCFINDFDSFIKSTTTKLEQFENNTEEHIKDYISTIKMLLESQTRLQQQLSDSSINRVAYFCDTVIQSSSYVAEINTTFFEKGYELLKKLGFNALVVVALSDRQAYVIQYIYGFTLHEDFEHYDKFGIDESYSILYKIL